MRDLASMLFVSLIGYATSGAFLGLAYFDFYYLLVALTSALAVLAARYRTEGVPEPVAPTPAPAGWGQRPRPGPPVRKINILQRASDWYQKL